MQIFQFLPSIAFVSSLSLLVGCSGQTKNVDGTNGGNSGNASSPLAGEWEGVGTLIGHAPTSVHITVRPGIFKVTASSGEILDAIGSNDDYLVAYTRPYGSSSAFHATRTGPTTDVGQLPIGIGGNWNLTNGVRGCTASLTASTAAGACDIISGLPNWAEPFSNGNTIGTKTATRTSIFGELGGTWSFTTSRGAQCEVIFDGSSAQATCTSPQSIQPDSVHITFVGTSASGGASSGLEFSAQRL